MHHKNRIFVITALLVLIGAASVHAGSEILEIRTCCGDTITGRLMMPDSGFTGKLVIDVPGTGPNTYLNRRKIGRSHVFNYHDFFGNEFNRRGIAYFSYNTRYTEIDTVPPNYDRVDKEQFCKITPSVEVGDLEEVVKYFEKAPHFTESRIILLGQSAGTIVATMVVRPDFMPVDALLLCGTPTENVYETIQWQLSGASSMINFRKFFDTNHDGIVQKSEYESGDPRALQRVGGQAFTALDLNGDSVLTADDFGIMLEPHLAAINDAIERGDNDWIWNNFFRVGAQWLKEHRTTPPNRERILKLDLPVYLFHGEDDSNCPVEGVLKLKQAAAEQGKGNIHVYTFPEHDHSLEFLAWAIHGEMPAGLAKLFDVAEQL